MRVAILGVCGTFMAGLAALAKQAGHEVLGYDQQVYPPMSDQLRMQGIELIEGYPATPPESVDVFIIGNAISRGNPLLEAILDQGLPFTSGPQWLGEQCLHQRWVLAVAGTHGKTTTTAMLTWILEANGYNPSFLVGGVPVNFGVTARLTDSQFFVIEADEYDTAFFDKRSKFVHYRPRTFVINNLEYDHADIFPDLAAIQTQFHHAVRAMPRVASCIVNQDVPAIHEVMAKGCWSVQSSFTGDISGATAADWRMDAEGLVYHTHEGKEHAVGVLPATVIGQHNRQNALAALAAAKHVGVRPEEAVSALARFRGVKRRLEVRGEVNGVRVIDDFAHHPTAIEATISALRHSIPKAHRVIAVFEPRSNTMKLGAMRARLAESFDDADYVYAYSGGVSWDVAESLHSLGEKLEVSADLPSMLAHLVKRVRSGDHVLIMSNGSFGGIHQKLLDQLTQMQGALLE